MRAKSWSLPFHPYGSSSHHEDKMTSGFPYDLDVCDGRYPHHLLVDPESPNQLLDWSLVWWCLQMSQALLRYSLESWGIVETQVLHLSAGLVALYGPIVRTLVYLLEGRSKYLPLRAL